MMLRFLLFVLPLTVSGFSVAATPAMPDEVLSGLKQFRQAGEVVVDLGEGRQQALYEAAEKARIAGRTDEAGRILAGMKEGYWAALGYLNLASDYAKTDLNPARALVALRVALAMSDGDADSERSQQLKNNLRVRAGYLAHQHGEFDKAISFLEKVDLDSFNTPRALYLHGLALAEKGNHRAAMQSWHRARKYPLAYPGVADAWIGMGRGYDLSGYLGQAGEAYLAANAAFESERVTLRKLAGKIREQGAYKTLVEDARETGVDWFLADSRTLTQPRMAYLLGFMEDPDAQRAAGRVAALRSMAVKLERHGHDLAVFQGALREQLVGIQQQDSRQSTADLTARGEELDAWVQRLANKAGPGQQARIQALRKTLVDTQTRLRQVRSKASEQPQTLQQLRRSAAALTERNEALLLSVRQLLEASETALDELALDYVEARDQGMAFALDKTEQQIAHLYEYLALQNLEETQP
jgi:tetratricopeptide (TPR) repeat protein